MAVSYKKLFHLLAEKDMTNAQLQHQAGFSVDIDDILEFVFDEKEEMRL